MVNKFKFATKSGADLPIGLPDIALEWNTDDDSLVFIVNGKALPPLTIAEASGLNAAMNLLHEKPTHDYAEGNTGATEGPRPEQAGPRIPDVGV